LWANRIPYGALSIVDGFPESNKSSLCLAVLARLSTGRAMPGQAAGDACVPDGAAEQRGAHSILLAAEDPMQEVAARLQSAGADRSKIHLLKPGSGQKIWLPDNMPEVRDWVLQTEAKALVIDPLSCYASGLSQEASARRVMSALAELAESSGAAVLVVRHLRKGQGADPLQQGLGSVAIAAAARSVLRVSKDPSRPPGGRIVTHLKNSFGPPSPPLYFTAGRGESGKLLLRFEQGPPGAAGGIDSPSIRARQFREAAVFLREYLARGPVRAQSVLDAAAARTIAPRTLTRAKVELQVRSDRRGFGPGSYIVWSLPAGAPSDSDAGQGP
jgi:hypothetical protein